MGEICGDQGNLEEGQEFRVGRGEEGKEVYRVRWKKWHSPGFLGKVAKRMYEGASWQDAVEAENPRAWSDVAVGWGRSLPTVLRRVEEDLAGGERLTVGMVRAEAARVMEAARGEEDLAKRATVLSKVSEVMANCHKVAKESGRGEYDHMTLEQVEDKIARLMPKGRVADD